MSSAELDEVLSAQKSSSDKTDLGYTFSSGLSSSMAFGSRTVFVPQSEKGDKGMKFKTDLTNFKSFIGPHVCHHVVFLDIFILIVLSCIFKSKCPNGHRFPLKNLHLYLESY